LRAEGGGIEQLGAAVLSCRRSEDAAFPCDIGVYRVVEAPCIEARCAVSETHVHLEE
jgi:hypothetical protein